MNLGILIGSHISYSLILNRSCILLNPVRVSLRTKPVFLRGFFPLWVSLV